MRFGDLPESLLQLCKFRLSLLPIFLSLLCGLICLLLLGGDLLPSKLRLRLRVRLILLRQVALLKRLPARSQPLAKPAEPTSAIAPVRARPAGGNLPSAG